MDVRIKNGTLEQKEIDYYIERAREKYGEKVVAIDIEIESDEEVTISYVLSNDVPFERIRRITGYLVGTLGKWNNAKRAEERDRVKHQVTQNLRD